MAVIESPPASELPDASPVAFKEWAGVCRAVASGRQTILLRKGGIAEESGRFVPEHRAFWLYPTVVHQAEQGLRDGFGEAAPTPSEGSVDLDVFVVVRSVEFLDRAEGLPALRPFHVWTDSAVEKRFAYRGPGLWVLRIGAYRRASPIRVVVRPEFLGCKTWVDLGDPVATVGLVPAGEAGPSGPDR